MQADNRPSCLVSEFLHSVAAQLAQAPQIPGYGVQVRGDPRLARLLNPASCAARPATVLARGILAPLSRCAPPPGPALLLLVDGLGEAELHRTDGGAPGLSALLVAALPLFPPWLRLVCSARPGPPALPGLTVISLDPGPGPGCPAAADLADYVCSRLESCAVAPALRTPLTQHVTARAGGCLLYTRLLLDLLQQGRLAVRSAGGLRLLPRTLAEIFSLGFSTIFPSTAAFQPAGALLSVVLASLVPLSQAELQVVCVV